LEGEWRASKNGGWEGEFEGVCKIEVYLEVLLELVFCTKPPNFGVETHMEAPTGVGLRLPTPVFLHILLQYRIFLTGQRDSLLYIHFSRTRHPLYLSLHPNYQQKDPHVSFFLFSPLSPPTPPTDPILPFSPAPWHAGPSPASAAAQASLLPPPVMAILPPQPRVGGRQSPSRARSRRGRASIPFVVGMAVVEGGRPRGRREPWRSPVRRRHRVEGAMAEPRPPPTGSKTSG
jgi:hypothetical protein